MSFCKGLCDTFENRVKLGGNKPFWGTENARMCSTCCVFLRTADLRCACCHNLLRTKSRNGVVKRRINGEK